MSITQSTISNNPGIGISNQGGRVTMFSSAVLANLIGIDNQRGVLNAQDSLIADNRVYGLSIGAVGITAPAVAELSKVGIIRNGRLGIALTNGELRAENITISGHANAGIDVVEGNVTLAYSTVAYNPGSGVDLGEHGTLTARNSIIALNEAGRNCLGAVVSLAGVNFACDETLTAAALGLDVLTIEAGTFVHPLLTGSPAIDAATGSCPAQDQRSYARPYGAACDVGAYEFGAGLHLEAGTPGIIEILPSETPTAAVTPTVGTVILLLDKNANCRHGPGSVYPVLTSVLAGQTVQLIGRNAQNTWWLSIIPGDYKCWISSVSGKPQGDPNSLPVLPDPPTPIPTTESGSDGTDFDKDGYTSDKDCDDKNAKIHPGAPETPDDKVDSNCNGNDDD